MAKQIYEIHIQGHLNRDWADWFEQMQMCCLESGEMILYGALADQAALLGVLNKLNRLNLAILSVNPVDRNEAEQTTQNEPAGKSEGISNKSEEK